MTPVLVDRSGFVYIVQADNGLVKIGRTKNFERRFKQLLRLPYPLTVVAVWPCEDAVQVEADKHWFWSDVRKQGEWFDIPGEHLQFYRESSGEYIAKDDDE